VHDEREAGNEGLDFGEHVEVQGLLALELERTVRGADGAGEGIAAGLLDEILGFLGVGEGGVAVLDLDVLFDTPSMPSSASTEMPFLWAASTTRLLISTFFSKVSWDASIMTELKKPELMQS